MNIKTHAFILGYIGKEASDSSGIGRWLALNALQGKAMTDNPIKTQAIQSPGQLVNLAGTAVKAAGNAGVGAGIKAASLPLNMAAAPLQNLANIPEGEEGEEYLNKHIDDAVEAKGKFGKSFGRGVDKMKTMALISSLIGGAAGGGLGYYAADKGKANAKEKLMAVLGGAGIGAVSGGAGSLLAGGVSESINDTILSRLSPETRERVVKRLAENRGTSGLPGGSIYGAYKTRDSAVEEN